MCVHPKALPRHRPARVPDRRLPTLDELGGEAWGSRSRLDNEPIRVELSLSTDRLPGDRVQERLGEPTLKLRSSFLPDLDQRPAEHKSALQSLMRISYAVLCLYKQIQTPLHYSNY